MMIPILKKENVSKKANIYQPLSLTSCLVKAKERIVNERLKSYLKSEDFLVPEQIRFRRFLNTEDQVTYLLREKEEAF